MVFSTKANHSFISYIYNLHKSTIDKSITSHINEGCVMANKVYENSQLICKYFKDAGIILHIINQWTLRSRFTVFSCSFTEYTLVITMQ